MSEPMSLMEFLQGLLSDAVLREHFLADPRGTLTEQGLAHLSPSDVHDALVLVEDTRTVDFGYGTEAEPGPFAPPPDDHPDAVHYLNSYLKADLPDHDVDHDLDHDLDLGPEPDDGAVPVVGPDDMTSFGAGDTTGHAPDLLVADLHAADLPFGSAAPAGSPYEDLAAIDADAGHGSGDGGTGPDTEPDDDVAGPADPAHDTHF